jgi:hypothetical protein
MNVLQGNNVRVVQGVPKASDFGSKNGTPLVIDAITGFAYFMFGDAILPLQTTTVVPGARAFSSGFDNGYY